MVDSRITKLAGILVNYSVEIDKKDVVLVNYDIEAKDLALEVYREIIKKGAYAKLNVNIPGFDYVFYKHASEEQLKHLPKLFLHEMKLAKAVITIIAQSYRELASADPGKLSMWSKTTRPIFELRLKRNNWVLCGYPSKSLAQEAGMPLEEFEDFVFAATNIDWEAASKRMDLLRDILNKAKKVQIIGDDTDLAFSIKGSTAIKCDGKYNMPDGEVFTAPRRDSVNGKVRFTYPSLSKGKVVTDIRLEFKDGRVVDASASKNAEFLNKMLDTDDGSRYLGEFGIGTNYGIKRFINNTLFDEKIGGTIHLALGNAYPESGGKNKSAIHWDIVTRPHIVKVDDRVILKDGEFMF